MGQFLDAAESVLMSEGKPLGAQDIVELGSVRGFLTTHGRTPVSTMRARLSSDILERGISSRFMRTASGMFALRSWSQSFEEFEAARFVKSPLDEDAIVFDADLIGKVVYDVGMTQNPLISGQDFLSLCRPMLRREAEDDFSVIQLVSCFIVRYEGQYLTYKRSKRLPEGRLHGEYSLNFGGHLTPDDFGAASSFGSGTLGLFDLFDPEAGYLFLLRELCEEVLLDCRPEFHYRGLIYDTRRDVSSQHLAIAYDVELSDPGYRIGERGFLMDDKFEPPAEVAERLADFENWSELIFLDDQKQAD